MAEVVAFNNAPIPNGREANPEVVAGLEELLDMAKSGEITGYAAALLLPGDFTTWRIIGRRTRSLLGAFELCKLDICKQALEDN